ncbi:MAG: PP2C family serine/threonine-protein phosphatase [bacterium]
MVEDPMSDRSGPKWQAIGKSVRGASHSRSGRPNQDAIQWTAAPGTDELPLVLAVSDGHGALECFRSHVGSRLAAEAATTVIHESLSEQSPPSVVKRWAQEKLPRQIVRRWQDLVADHLADTPPTKNDWRQLEAEAGVAERRRVVLDPVIAYGATLLSIVVAESFILYLQLGDGDILSVSEAGQVTRPPLPPDERLFANETTTLCASDPWRDFRSHLHMITDSSPALLLACTDGYANSFRDEQDFLKVGVDFLDQIRLHGLDGVTEKMEGWLDEASRRGSGDDITLGIVCRMDAVDRPATGGRVPEGRSEQQQPESSTEALENEGSDLELGPKPVSNLEEEAGP